MKIFGIGTDIVNIKRIEKILKRNGPLFKKKIFSEKEIAYCDSKNTLIRSNFGSTLCRSMHYCKECKQGFEHFKPI